VAQQARVEQRPQHLDLQPPAKQVKRGTLLCSAQMLPSATAHAALLPADVQR
jgi:hypothetical protein